MPEAITNTFKYIIYEAQLRQTVSEHAVIKVLSSRRPMAYGRVHIYVKGANAHLERKKSLL